MGAMDLNAVVNGLDIKNSYDLFKNNWEKSQKCMPLGEFNFLEQKYIVDTTQRAGLSDMIIKRLVETGKCIADNPALKSLFWHYHFCIFQSADAADYMSTDQARHRLALDCVLKGDTGMFYTLLLLSGFPASLERLQKLYRKRSIPERILYDTVFSGANNDPCGMLNNPKGFKSPGEFASAMTILDGKVFRLGRLQFEIFNYDPKRKHSETLEFRVYRNRQTKVAIALSGDGVKYSDDGQMIGIYNSDDGSRHSWTSRFFNEDNQVCGCPIMPDGYTINKVISLAKKEWIQVFGPGDPAIFFHVPGGSPLDYESCGHSFKQAMDFFTNHFPDHTFKAFFCTSWILDNQLERLLPLTSNMARLQKEVYLFPCGQLRNDHLLGYVFTTGKPDELSRALTAEDFTTKLMKYAAQASQDTNLQRSVLEHYLKGKRLEAIAGGCFLLPEDFEWGRQVYRNQSYQKLINTYLLHENP